MTPLIITVAAVGAELALEDQPGLPVTPQQLAHDAASCVENGAAIYHLHVRDAGGEPTMAVEAFREAKESIEAAVDVIVQFTTGGAVGDDETSRVAPLELKPEMATLTTGTVNFGDEVFFNPAPLVRRFHRSMVEKGILPEFEIFEAGMIETAERIYSEIGATHHKHFDLVLGVPGALPAWPGIVRFLADRLPAGATWSATGIGKAHHQVAEETLAAGGHLRTGLEDVRYLGPGERASSNAQLVGRAAAMGRSSGRVIASPAVAREILGLR